MTLNNEQAREKAGSVAWVLDPTSGEQGALDDLLASHLELAAEVERYRASLTAHHEFSTLSAAAIRESAGWTCQICARAHNA